MNPPHHLGRSVWRLALVQALAGSSATIVFATGAVIGRDLAPSPDLATLPVSFFMVGMASATLPAGALAQRHGRIAVFLIGKLAGVLAGLLGAAAIALHAFALFCVAIFLSGVHAAVLMSYRFVAAQCVAADQRPRAVATVLAGGIVAGLCGGWLATGTMSLVPRFPFLATYLTMAAIIAGCGLFVARTPLPVLHSRAADEGRGLGTIARQPRFLAAIVCGAVSYLLMNYLMTSAPLAMRLHGHAQGQANAVVQWHVVAMYAPSLLTGRLIARWGTMPVTALGLLVTLGSALLGLVGTSNALFLASMVVLGIGWNFGFAGASSMVLECHEPAESARVQAFNDFLIFSIVAVGSFLSGNILMRFGWEVVCLLAVPLGVMALIALVLLGRRGRELPGAEAPKAVATASLSAQSGIS
ncbi:MFS transporter [Novosphingobium sp. 1949]|uniref:MFS transporter n=1 Tax=Novosphingobium organovorum TaxID=2930092 RepID=A0ABT0BC92_9SPHN|nr:MFS transporter [Novosphingobium organovorum]MCJ2182520.1 MFS transporter [Novosphingobium organovorum]